jgi:hypothetical protein
MLGYRAVRSSPNLPHLDEICRNVCWNIMLQHRAIGLGCARPRVPERSNVHKQERIGTVRRLHPFGGLLGPEAVCRMRPRAIQLPPSK